MADLAAGVEVSSGCASWMTSLIEQGETVTIQLVLAVPSPFATADAPAPDPGANDGVVSGSCVTGFRIVGFVANAVESCVAGTESFRQVDPDDSERRISNSGSIDFAVIGDCLDDSCSMGSEIVGFCDVGIGLEDA
jgi:hypothetical protein